MEEDQGNKNQRREKSRERVEASGDMREKKRRK